MSHLFSMSFGLYQYLQAQDSIGELYVFNSEILYAIFYFIPKAINNIIELIE